MNSQRRYRSGILGLSLILTALNAQSQKADSPDNGIFVDAKIYDTRTLQTQLQILSGRLGQISGIDQGSITSRIGSLQGASSTQTGFSLQANALASPSVATTTNAGTPSNVQTNGGTTTSGTPSSVATVGGTTASAGQTVTTTVSNGTTTNNSSVTTTPSTTTQTVTTMPSVTPAPPALPATTPIASPSSFSASALDTLNEQMQLSYQIINLQLLLQGALSDDYTPKGLGRRHVTFGFPIYVSTPYAYRGAAAEVEVSVCNPGQVLDDVPPTVQTIIPQEKTYNVASIVGKSVGLGAGAVVAHVVNIGANFAWTHQTFYVVKQQDTVALRRDRATNVPPCPGKAPGTVIAWQFRPVLGQKTVDQGARSTFAQLAFAPSSNPAHPDTVTQIAVRTCWREYHQKSGIVGDRLDGSCSPALDQPAKIINLSTAYNTTNILSVEPRDNGDGTVTSKVRGRFPSGTRIGIGESYMDESVAGFENTGDLLRFTAPAQSLALRGARLVSPDGTDTDVLMNGHFDEPSQVFRNKNGDIPNPRNETLLYIPWDTTRVPAVFDVDTRLSVDPVGPDGIVIREPSGLPNDWKARLRFFRDIDPVRPEPCLLPYADAPELNAAVASYNDTMALITVPLVRCSEIGPSILPKMYVVILNGKAFGLSDAPFYSFDDRQLTVLVPKTFIQGQQRLKLRRLFLDDQYESRYRLIPSSVAYTGITLARSTKLGATFAITGSRLTKARFEFPWKRPVSTSSDTFALVSLTTDELSSVKQLVLAPGDGNTSPIMIPLPSVAKAADDSGDDVKARFPITLMQSDDTDSRYAIVATLGIGTSLKGATFLLPDSPKPDILKNDERNLWFSLKAKDAKAFKEVAIQLVDAAGKPSSTILVTLPTPPKSTDDTASTTKVTLKDDATGLKQGATGPYTIKGTNLKLVVSIKYLGVELPIHYAADFSSVTIDQLPAGFTANPGKSPLEFHMTDGSKQSYGVTITK
jgi:hypothetical protein